ncbi:MAG: hypothetical protein IKO32_01855 [Lachnospiraceae bacterium]|nr:hypothetical protein [Lachnospiraceae bacterium]
MQVKYNASEDVLYVHNPGYDGNPFKPGIFMTVHGDEKDKLMDYIKNNRIEIETEHN